MALSALQKALVESGLVEEPELKKSHKQKKNKCRICGAPMEIIEGTNVMSCTGEKCRNFFLFGGKN